MNARYKTTRGYRDGTSSCIQHVQHPSTSFVTAVARTRRKGEAENKRKYTIHKKSDQNILASQTKIVSPISDRDSSNLEEAVMMEPAGTAEAVHDSPAESHEDIGSLVMIRSLRSGPNLSDFL